MKTPKIQFALYGSGWRSEFFLRVARYLPERFQITGVITRNQEKADRFKQEFGVDAYSSIEALLECTPSPSFVVVSVAAHVNVEISLKLLNMGIPVLLETPPARSIDDLMHFHQSLPSGAKIQIAEQYPQHPLHQARLNLIASGRLGNVQHTQVSFSHGYHGMSLIRKFLGIGFENAEILASSFPVNVLGGFTRDGRSAEEVMKQKNQTIAVLKFDAGQKTALLNFESDQHRSWVRTPIIQIKGDRGEIFNDQLKYVKPINIPIEAALIRSHMGQDQNLEGTDLKGIQADGEWLYTNPYQGSRLADDEIAVAHCLEKMCHYVQTNESFYSFAEAAQDTYLALLIDESINSGEKIISQTQPWA